MLASVSTREVAFPPRHAVEALCHEASVKLGKKTVEVMKGRETMPSIHDKALHQHMAKNVGIKSAEARTNLIGNKHT